MSFKLIKEVWRLKLTGTQQHVLIALADYADDDGRNCFPSHKRLAWKLGCTTKTLQRVIPELIALGVVEVLRPATNKAPPRYRICVENGPFKEPYQDDLRADKMSTPDSFSVDILSAQDNLSGQNVHSRVDILSARGVKMSTDPVINQSYNQPDNEIGLLPEKEQEQETAAETAQSWATCLQELGGQQKTLRDWLQGSELLPTRSLRDGKPLYRLLVVNPAHVQWLRHQADHAIRSSLRGVLGRSVAIDIVAELEATR